MIQFNETRDRKAVYRKVHIHVAMSIWDTSIQAYMQYMYMSLIKYYVCIFSACTCTVHTLYITQLQAHAQTLCNYDKNNFYNDEKYTLEMKGAILQCNS